MTLLEEKYRRADRWQCLLRVTSPCDAPREAHPADDRWTGDVGDAQTATDYRQVTGAAPHGASIDWREFDSPSLMSFDGAPRGEHD